MITLSILKQLIDRLPHTSAARHTYVRWDRNPPVNLLASELGRDAASLLEAGPNPTAADLLSSVEQCLGESDLETRTALCTGFLQTFSKEMTKRHLDSLTHLGPRSREYTTAWQDSGH